MTRSAGLRSAAHALVSRVAIRARIVEGVLGGSDRTFRCLFVGDSLLVTYMLNRMYVAPPAILRSWRAWIPSLTTLLRKPPAPAIDLCVAVLPKAFDARFRERCDFFTRDTIRQVLDIPSASGDARGAFRKKRKEAERRIRKNGLACRVSRAPEDFEFFFQRMYVPHARRQFRSLATVNAHDVLRRGFERGSLLIVLNADSAVAAGISFIDGGRLVFRWLGVLDGDDLYVRQGVQAALYYFMIEHAEEHGLRAVDMTVSYPFLTDGVYRHKHEWGAGTFPDDEAERSAYFFNVGHPDSVARFYQENPVVAHARGGLWGAVGLRGAAAGSPEAHQEQVDRFRAPGLDGLFVMTPESNVPVEIRFAGDPGGLPGTEVR